MAINVTHFESADRDDTSTYKFVVADDPAIYVWFTFADGPGQLYTTVRPGPFRSDDPLENASFGNLEELMTERGTSVEQWTKDLMAQYGEYIGWAYP